MANGTYGDTAYNPLIGYTDGLRKNYDNKNWVFYDPRKLEPSWLVGPFETGFQSMNQRMLPFALGEISDEEAFPIFLAPGPSGGTYSFKSPVATGQVNQYSLLRCPAQEGGPGIGIGNEPRSRSYTFEGMFKLPPEVYDARAPYSALSFDFGSIGYFQIGRYWTLDNESPQGAFDPFVLMTVGLGDMEFYYISNSTEGFPIQSGAGEATILPDLDSTEWRHVAIVQTPGDTANARNFSFYYNGERIAELLNISDPEVLPLWQDNVLEVVLQSGLYVGTLDPWNGAQSGAIHGIRYTPRALYTSASFTPPTSITALA
jgi:hypothetical protein